MSALAAWALVAGIAAGAGLAEPLAESLRPVARPGSSVVVIEGTGALRPRPRVQYSFDIEVTRFVAGAGTLHPTRRPAHPHDAFAVAPAVVIVPAGPGAPQPQARPVAFKKLFGGGKRKSAQGSVCGVNAIRGTEIKDIGNPGRGCGIDRCRAGIGFETGGAGCYCV